MYILLHLTVRLYGSGRVRGLRNEAMFRRVLFPTDFSSHARRTLECVAGLPGIGEIILLHVAELPGRGMDRSAEEDILAGTRKSLALDRTYLETRGLAVHCRIRTSKSGSIGPIITGTADSDQVSAIVMSARGKSRVQGILLGTVSQHVLRHAKVPLLIMRHQFIEDLTVERYNKFCPMIFSSVLCPTDFSDFAQDTIRRIASMQGIGRILLVHVVTHGETAEEILALEREAAQQLHDIATTITQEGIPATPIVRTGNTADEVLAVAKEADCSLIALNSYGRGWFSELLIGSTAAGIARNADRPVLVVRDHQVKDPRV
jgi:nucleotide-binding universal stress UspA family protein